MASGAIVGMCPACDEWIFEDEWELDGRNRTLHAACLKRRRIYGDTAAEETLSAITLLESLGYKVMKFERSNSHATDTDH